MCRRPARQQCAPVRHGQVLRDQHNSGLSWARRGSKWVKGWGGGWWWWCTLMMAMQSGDMAVIVPPPPLQRRADTEGRRRTRLRAKPIYARRGSAGSRRQMGMVQLRRCDRVWAEGRRVGDKSSMVRPRLTSRLSTFRSPLAGCRTDGRTGGRVSE